MELTPIILKVVYALLVIIVMMTLAGYSVLAERKVSSWIQGRVGPNRTVLPVVGAIPVIGPALRYLGIFQLPADGLKFLFKEDPVPGHVNRPYYYLAPILALTPALLTVLVVPFGQYYNAQTGQVEPLILANIDIGILFILAVSSLGVYGIVLAGWAANSKYPFLGGIRSSAQMISYELAMGLSILPVFMWANPPGGTGTLTLNNVVVMQEGLWFVLTQPVSALVFLIALFAETNRLPFDMPESETDLVGGFHTEYGSFKFGLFFVTEYAHMFIGSAVFTVLFFGGWHILPFVPWPDNLFGIPWLSATLSVIWFILKTLLLVFIFMWVRWTLPRFRYDQVMAIGWKMLLPLAIANLLVYTIGIAIFDILNR